MHPTVTLDERADRIIGAVEQAAVIVGAELTAAKAEHPGEFVAWVQSGVLPFGLDKAERLMAIHRAFEGADEHTKSMLPPRWTALYEITRLPSERTRELVEVGRIHPDMTTASARELVAEHRRTESPLPPLPDPPKPATRNGLTAAIVANELMRFERHHLDEPTAVALSEWLNRKADR